MKPVLGLLSLMPLAACEAAPTAQQFAPRYHGVETRLLKQDLVQFNVSMTNALGSEDIEQYAECAAAGYTVIRGWGFARHIRTTVEQEADGIWTADAVYTISPELPQGLKTIDAQVVTADCAEKGIPIV